MVLCFIVLSSRAKPVWSTAKDVLEKLRPLHPLPGVILEWRRLTASLTKVVFPLQRGRTYCKALGIDRMHSIVDTFTSTGRVTMHEPNLQNVPKDFVIEIPSKKLCIVCNLSCDISTVFVIYFSITLSYLTTVLYWSPSLLMHPFLTTCTISSCCWLFLDPEGGSQKATLVVPLLVVVISSLKIPKSFLICSVAQRNFAYTFLLTFPTDLPSQIFELFSN